MRIRRGLAGVVVGLPLLLALAGCAGREAAAPASPSASAAAPASAAARAGDVDVCAMVPRAQLEAAIGADPGDGVAAKGRVDGGQCTWRVSDTHTVLAQYTRQPDVYLPDGVWTPSKQAATIAGTTRGFADAASHTILVVKDGQGLLLNDVRFRDADQAAYEALGKAIAAQL